MLQRRKTFVAGGCFQRHRRTRFRNPMLRNPMLRNSTLSRITFSRTTFSRTTIRRHPTTTTNNMKTLWLLPLGLVLSCWYCGTAWTQNKIEVNNGQTKIESDQADPPDSPPGNATPNRKIVNPGTPGDPGSETSTFSAVNNNITTILQDYQELTGKTVIEDSNLSANAVPITILVPNPVPREQLIRLIEAALLLNNYAFVP